MKRIIIPIAMALLLPALLVAAEEQTLKMKIEGLKCPLCPPKIEKQLSTVCKKITVDLKKGEGVCTHEPPVTVDQIMSEANKTGFKTTQIN